MQKKSDDFSVEEALRMAKSPAGQQLLALLQQQNGQALENIAAQAAQGEYHNASRNLEQLLSSQEAKQLLEQLRR